MSAGLDEPGITAAALSVSWDEADLTSVLPAVNLSATLELAYGPSPLPGRASGQNPALTEARAASLFGERLGASLAQRIVDGADPVSAPGCSAEDIAVQLRRDLGANTPVYRFFQQDLQDAAGLLAEAGEILPKEWKHALRLLRGNLALRASVVASLDMRDLSELPHCNAAVNSMIGVFASDPRIADASPPVPERYLRSMARLFHGKGLLYEQVAHYPELRGALADYLIRSWREISALGLPRELTETHGHRFTAHDAERAYAECAAVFGCTPILNSVFGNILRGRFGPLAQAVNSALAEYGRCLEEAISLFADADPSLRWAVSAANAKLLNPSLSLEGQRASLDNRHRRWKDQDAREAAAFADKVLLRGEKLPKLVGAPKGEVGAALNEAARLIGSRLAAYRRGNLTDTSGATADDLQQAAALAGFERLRAGSASAHEITARMVLAAEQELRQYSKGRERQVLRLGRRLLAQKTAAAEDSTELRETPSSI
jgi:hypothetical protein